MDVDANEIVIEFNHYVYHHMWPGMPDDEFPLVPLNDL